jgi:hypothetical protein
MLLGNTRFIVFLGVFSAAFSGAFLSLSAANASPSPSPSPDAIYREFATTCISVFTQSAGSEEHGGKSICECTAEESKHQGVTRKELIHETAEIKKDPKYKIKNKKLLASIQYCTVLSMEDVEEYEEQNKDKQKPSP